MGEWAGHDAVVGIDDGFNNTKIVLENGACFIQPSRAASGNARTFALNGTPSPVLEYQTEGEIFHAGPIDGQPTRHDDYPVSVINRIVVHHALHEAGVSGQKLGAISGLPVRMFFQKGGKIKPNEKLIDGKTRNLQTPVDAPGRSPVKIVSHQVLPEGFAAWFDYIITEEGGLPKLDKERERHPIAIIDIGGRTTDYAVICDKSVQIDSSGSIEAGMLKIRDQVSDMIVEKFDCDVPTQKLLDAALAAGKVRLAGREHNVTDLVSQACRDVLHSIRAEAQTKLGKGAELERVIFIGGGTQALGGNLDGWFPHQEVPEKPIYANARGMAKFAKYVAR